MTEHNEQPQQSVPVELRDARPFLAFYLRMLGEERAVSNGRQLHLVARWVENLPARDRRMRQIEETGALDYTNGAFSGGEEADALIAACAGEEETSWNVWLDEFADAVRSHWQRR